ncbi:alpha/beta hydrolase [Streptomyces mashuensis]|nr:alpha/beta hydrolase [Streptomyces mashuensis]
MDLAALKGLEPDDFDHAADGYRGVSNTAGAVKESLENKIAAGMRKVLSGVAADAALKQLQELTKDYRYIQIECGLVSTALKAFASDIRPPKKKLDDALEDARAKNFSVGADGSVTYPGVDKGKDGKPAKGGTAQGLTDTTAQNIGRQAATFNPNPNYGLAQDCANRIAEALKAATEVDEKWAPALRRLKADDDLTVSDADWADAGQDMNTVRSDAKSYLDHIKPPPANGTPKDNRAWWDSLSDQQKFDYLATHPDGVGRLDGLPAAVRDQANRTVLDETHGRQRLKLDEWLKKEPERYEKYYDKELRRSLPVKGNVETEEWKEWNKRRGELQDRLKGMEAIQSRFDMTGRDNHPQTYLLGFDNTGRGRAIVSIGNPDTADNVATYVPGTFACLDKIGGEISRAETLGAKVQERDPGHQTASIAWLGYDAPQSIVPEAQDPKYANAAREPLANFLKGIQAANGRDVNSTLIGHSYGSLVAGETLRDNPGLPVDKAVFVGSPGVGVMHAKDLHLPPDHVFAATAKNDLINLVPPNPGRLAPLNPRAYARWFDDHEILYGNDPTSDEFGGQRFHVADGPMPAIHGDMMPAHSDYWKKESLEHMTNVVVKGRS